MILYTRTVIESPFAGDTELNRKYLNIAIRDSIIRYAEAPVASHMMYTEALDDLCPQERMMGMEAGFSWHGVVDKVVVYTDLGVSSGMELGIGNAERIGTPIEYRKLNLTKQDIIDYNF